MLSMKKIAVAVLACTATVAVAQQVKPEDQVKYRQAAYRLMGLSMSHLGAMAQEKKPFNKEEAQRYADLIGQVSTIPREYFGEGTGKDTKAKPEIWSKRAEFDQKMDRMVAEAGKLSAVVRAGDMGAFKKQFSEVGAACKSCHDEFRAK
jgi:cytochrome c556